MTQRLISPEIVQVLARTAGDIVAYGPRIILLGRHGEPRLFADATLTTLTGFLNRVLESAAAHLHGSPQRAAAPSALDAALAREVLRSLARRSCRDTAAEAWQLALNLFLLGTDATLLPHKRAC